MMNPVPAERPRGVSRVCDEIAWELVRDEWDLLLAVGTGPTSAESAASALGRCPVATASALVLLETHGLVRATEAGYSLVPAFYERREGMASYLRDIVLDRLRADTSPPIAGDFRDGFVSVDAMASFIAAAEEDLLPGVVDLASQPESEESQRFSVIFAVADELSLNTQGLGFRAKLLEVLRSAAAIRSLDPSRKSAYLWVAEMRTDPHVAADVGEYMQRFFELQASSPSPTTERGAAVFAVLSAPRSSRR